jgi:hypothetical protein
MGSDGGGAMSDPMTLFVGIAAQLKTAAEIAIGLGKLHTMAEVNAKAIELQGAILGLQSDAFAAHSQQSTMVERIRDLEKELARVKAWEETKQRYQLYQPLPGTFVYALKEHGGSAEPAHWICAHCYESGKRSILQFLHQDYSYTNHWCPDCKSEFHTGPGKKMPLGMA